MSGIQNSFRLVFSAVQDSDVWHLDIHCFVSILKVFKMTNFMMINQILCKMTN